MSVGRIKASVVKEIMKYKIKWDQKMRTWKSRDEISCKVASCCMSNGMIEFRYWTAVGIVCGNLYVQDWTVHIAEQLKE